MIHEAIHCHQRKYSKEWQAGCRRAGWTPVATTAIPLQFRNRVRINPDTMAEPFWAWNSYQVPLPIFRERPRLQDTAIQWLDLRTGTLFHEAPPSFVKLYGTSIDQPEHPYEIYAELFSKKLFTTSDAILENLTTL